MKKFLLDYGLKVRLPIILFVAAAAFAFTYYVTYAERNGIGYQPEQPINYSHKLHAGDMKIDCKYCHIGVEKSRVASVPAVNVCMGCHAIAKKDSPEIQKLTHGHFTVTGSSLREIPHAGLGRHGGSFDVVSADRDLAGGWRNEACDHAHGGGLARAVGAQKSQHLARSHAERQIVNGQLVAIAFG